MNVGIAFAIVAWEAAVSFVAALKIKDRLLVIVVAVSLSAGLPLMLGLLFTSLFPWSPLGPEEFLQKGWKVLIGGGAANLAQTLLSVLAGVVLGFGGEYIIRKRRRV